jgi:hypothetical protein
VQGRLIYIIKDKKENRYIGIKQKHVQFFLHFVVYEKIFSIYSSQFNEHTTIFLRDIIGFHSFDNFMVSVLIN